MERYRLYLFLSKAGTDAIHLLNCIELAEVQHSDDIDPSSLFHFADLMPSPAREVIRLAMLLRMNKALPVSTDGLPTGIAKSLLRFRELLVGGHVRSQLINVQGEEIDGHAVSQALVPTDDPEAAEFSSLVATVLERWHMGPVPALVGNR